AHQKKQNSNSTAAIPPGGALREFRTKSRFTCGTEQKKRADERTRTADLLITNDKQAVAAGCTALRIPHI
ncbi:MAG: hypothetical protein ACREXR_20790, partial [Gammaproteobacteria bacterium]